MKKIFLTLTLILFVQLIFAQTTINWLDFETAIEMQKENPKQLLLICTPTGAGGAKKWMQKLFKIRILRII